jgi:hypothetical protein
VNPVALYELVGWYLCEGGWYQDGLDPGLWRRGDGYPGPVTVGDAFDWQLGVDGVDQSFVLPDFGRVA